MPRNYFASDPLSAGLQGFEDAGAMSDSITRRYANNRAAPRIAQGDYRGAAEAYGAVGMAPEASRLEQEASGRDAEAAEAQAAQAKAQRAEQMAAAEQRLAILKNVGGELMKTQLGQRSARLQGSLMLFRQAGYPEEVVARLAQTPEESLTDESIRAITGQVEAEFKQFFQNEQGIYGVAPDGRVSELQKFDRKPTIVPQGSTVLGPDNKPVYTAPKTFAPRASSGGGGGGGPRPGPPVNIDPNSLVWK